MSILRQPTGAPASTGGQFAPAAKTANGTELPARTPASILGTLTERAFPTVDEAGSVLVISRVEAQRAARKVLAALTDDEFFNNYWYGIESAAMQYQRFAGDGNGEEAATASPADTRGVDLGGFFGTDGPDRAGENGYAGYDFAGYAEEIADEWRLELDARIDRAVAADAAARSAAATSVAVSAA